MSKGMLGNNETLRRIMSGPLCDLAIKLNGQDSDEWETALAKFLRKEPVWTSGQSATPRAFPVYLEIETGGKSKEELFAEMKAGGHFVSDWAKDVMSKDDWKPGEKQMVKFARAKISELGFTKKPKTREVWARIRELGHGLCEPQDGPAIRLTLKDQSRGDYFWTAMEQIADSSGGPRVFCVERLDDGKSWLLTRWTFPDFVWDLDDEVVFRLCK